jgi:hypothetical protein
LHTSAWMRATSPSGSAAHEDKVQWSGELGYGIRAPERGQHMPEPEPEVDAHAGHDDGHDHDDHGGHGH